MCFYYENEDMQIKRMYTKTKEIPVEPELDNLGCPVNLELTDKDGERVQIPVLYSCFCEALRSSYHSNFKTCTQIYAYKYKVRICLHNQIKTCNLIQLLEDESWILKVS